MHYDGYDFVKFHGLGNDYLVMDPARTAWRPEPAAIRAICNRNYGPGSDGILFGPLQAGPGPDLRIYNPDGSEAEKSGNGLRIFAWYLHERGLLPPQGRALTTKGGTVFVRVMDADRRIVEVDMGSPSFLAADIGLRTDAPELVGVTRVFDDQALDITCVSMGNPHCVILMPGADEAIARQLGPLVESDPLFIHRTNVQFMSPVSRNEIRIQIWERGAGYTLASGSSSCAAASAARRMGLVDDDVTVIMPGGSLQVSFREGHAYLVGPVEPVCAGVLLEPLAGRVGLAKPAGGSTI